MFGAWLLWLQPWSERIVVPRRKLCVAVAAAVVLLSGCTGDDRPLVRTERVSSGEVTQTVSAPASVQPAAQQDVAAAVSGVVLRLRVDDGERVRQGQEVLRLTSAQVDLAREQAAAARAAAAGVGGVRVDGGGHETRRAAEQAVRRLDESTRPRLRRARRQARRIDDREQRNAALAAIDAVEASYESTRTALREAGRTVARQQDATADALSRALQQAVDSVTAPQRLQAQAAAEAAERQADDLVVTAPFAGTVQFGEAAASTGAPLPADVPPELAGLAGSLGGLGGGEGGGTLQVGAPVVAGQTLFSVYDLSQVYVVADVDEVDAPQLRVGQRATVIVDAFADTPLEGTLERIAVAATPTAAGGVGYPVHIRLLGPVEEVRSPVRRLRVGMTATVDIATVTETSDLVVPSRALLLRDGRDVVYVVRDGVAREVEVEVLALGDERAAVRGDLEADDDVVVSGYEELSDGDEVATE